MTRQACLVLFLTVSLIVFSGCNKEHHITLSQNSTILHHGETHQVPAQCEDPISYFSNDNYVAMVSSSGLITAQYVGQTIINMNSKNDNKTYNVKVVPRYNLYPEPNISFGESKSSVISKYGDPDGETSTTIVYNNYSTNALMLMVTFDGNRVKNYGVVVSKNYTTELSNFLSERYKYVNYSDGIYLYMNALTTNSATMTIGRKTLTLSGNSNYWLVLYMNAQSKNTDFKSFENEMELIFTKRP